ncbi:MAG TPA: hypothetical protein VM030_00395 [Acidimicrobiales bacterium]|nr:hypothetical protein [Acidimicrobiales bacterium]
MSGLTASTGAALGGISILGAQYTRGAGGTVMAFTGFAFGVYVAIALALIITGFVMRRAASRHAVEA